VVEGLSWSSVSRPTSKALKRIPRVFTQFVLPPFLAINFGLEEFFSKCAAYFLLICGKFASHKSCFERVFNALIKIRALIASCIQPILQFRNDAGKVGFKVDFTHPSNLILWNGKHQVGIFGGDAHFLEIRFHDCSDLGSGGHCLIGVQRPKVGVRQIGPMNA
jgi:hypothetical protein